MVWRKYTDRHLNKACSQKMLSYSNKHCEYRAAESKYKKFGCNGNGLRNMDVKNHMDEYKLGHMTNKFDFISSNVCEYYLVNVTNCNVVTRFF